MAIFKSEFSPISGARRPKLCNRQDLARCTVAILQKCGHGEYDDAMTNETSILDYIGSGAKGGRKRRRRKPTMDRPLQIRVDAGRAEVYYDEAAMLGLTFSEMARRALDDFVKGARQERRRVSKTPAGDAL